MFKYSSAKYYKKSKKGFKKNLVKGIMIFLKNKKQNTTMWSQTK